MKFKVEKDFMVDKYRCAIVGHSAGHRCGYVGIPKNHPAHGKSYEDLYDVICVHGGLTYSGERDNYPVDNEGLWWIGFDCGHCDDGIDLELIKELAEPALYQHYVEMNKMFPTYGTVRDTDYVDRQLVNMVAQLIEYEVK